MYAVFLYAGLALCLFAQNPSFAQQTYSPPTNIIAGPQYDHLARQALDKPAHFDFISFRSFYTGTPQYDPLASDTQEWMYRLSYKAQNDPDPQKRREALREYGELVMDHLANLDVVTLALTLAQGDRRFGDPALFEWLRRGLVKNVVDTGTGKNLLEAYGVITMAEETALLKALKVRVLSTEARESGGTYYNMHEVEDALHTGPYTVFVNTSYPMRHLVRQRAAAGIPLNIPKQ